MMASLCFVLLVLSGLGICKTLTSFEASNNKNESLNAEEFEATIVGVVDSISKKVYRPAYRVFTGSNISMHCSLSLLQFFTDIRKLKGWAWKMLDASFKPSAGIFEGTTLMLGDYDECLDINLRNARGKFLFQGKYCMITLKMFDEESILNKLKRSQFFSDLLTKIPESPLSPGAGDIRIGLCIPSTCTAQELNQIVRVVARNIIKIESEVSCEIKTKKIPNAEQIAILCIFAAFGFLVIIGTCLDVIHQCNTLKNKSGKLNKLLRGFSIYTNTISLFGTVRRDVTLSAVCGCRVLTACWVVLIHVYYSLETQIFKYRRTLQMKEWVEESITFRTIMCGALSIDTFFLLSGMLFLYTNWQKFEKSKGCFNSLLSVVQKIARILPLEMIIIGIFMISPLFSDGPISELTYKNVYSKCKQYWWYNLLFIQNFWTLDEICLSHTWFIATLFQLFVATFWVIWLLYRWSKIGITVSATLIMIGCLLTGFLKLHYSLPSTFSPFIGVVRLKSFSVTTYTNPLTYLPTYCIGIFLGYAIVKKRSPKIKPRIQMISWFMSICGVLTAMYSCYYFDINGNSWINIVYASLHRAIWSSSVSWMLYACVTGYGGFIGELLSWKPLIVLDKLTLLIYLVHPLVLTFNTAVTRSLINLGHVEQVYTFLATLTASVIISYFLNVVFEQPLKHIELLLTSKFSTNPFSDVCLPSIGKHSEVSPVLDNKMVMLSSKATNGERVKF